MKKSVILATAVVTLALATPVSADNKKAVCGDTSGKWMSHEAVTAIAADKGYSVRRIKREDGCFEIYAINRNGGRVELYMNPLSGEIVKVKNKS